jgi:hypothetical protein
VLGVVARLHARALLIQIFFHFFVSHFGSKHKSTSNVRVREENIEFQRRFVCLAQKKEREMLFQADKSADWEGGVGGLLVLWPGSARMMMMMMMFSRNFQYIGIWKGVEPLRPISLVILIPSAFTCTMKKYCVLRE